MLKKSFKISGIVIVFLLVSFFSVRYYINNGGKRDIASEVSAFNVSSKTIINEFTSNTEASIFFPFKAETQVTENGKSVVLSKSAEGKYYCKVGSGNYIFRMKRP